MKTTLVLSLFLITGMAWSQAPERFPDFGYAPSPGEYAGKVFKLSQRYPIEAPKPEERPAFFQTDFKAEPLKYLLEAREYCFEGNLGHADIEDDFRLGEAFADLTKPPRWYHMPWQHWGPMGREGIHGLTKEAPVGAYALAATQKSEGQTYAVAFYNQFASATIHKVWERFIPNPAVTAVDGGGFPDGSVVFKLLFVTNPVEEIPFLGKAEDCVQWNGYVTEKFMPLDNKAKRTVKKLSLVQMDIMVKDARADFGWIFGTYQYNSQAAAKVKWNRLVPVGLQWSNDPNNTDLDPHTSPKDPNAKIAMNELKLTPRNEKLLGTWVNPSPDLPATHLGWNGRLNGPVDNPMSSCMSCHQTAQYPFVSLMGPTFLRPKDTIPSQGSKGWMHWFRDLKCGENFDAGSDSTDGSLQLAMSIRNFYDWFKTEQGGIVRSTYVQEQERAAKMQPESAQPSPAALEENRVILRDELPGSN